MWEVGQQGLPAGVRRIEDGGDLPHQLGVWWRAEMEKDIDLQGASNDGLQWQYAPRKRSHDARGIMPAMAAEADSILVLVCRSKRET